MSAAEPAPATEDLTELLTAPAAEPVAQAEPAETVAEAPVAPTATISEAADGSLVGTEVRTWRDNTGTFEVTGRLVVVMPDKVRLLKDNGRFTTVPMRRLSTDDRQYVEQTLAKKNGQPAKFITTK